MVKIYYKQSIKINDKCGKYLIKVNVLSIFDDMKESLPTV